MSCRKPTFVQTYGCLADALMVQQLRRHLDRHARATFKRLMSDHQRERQRLRAQINQKARRQYVNDLALEDY
jgi:hypothetical protein